MGALSSLYLRTMPRRSLIAALSLQQQLAHYVTQYDIQQARRRFYNPHALALYLKAADRAADMVADGLPLADALPVVSTTACCRSCSVVYCPALLLPDHARSCLRSRPAARSR
jgi:hypothetical protein